MEFNPVFLIIDDNLIDQLVTQQLLKKVLHVNQVVIVNNGQEGLQWILNSKKETEKLIVLLDIQMPVMNGFEFLEEFQKLNDGIKNEIQIYIVSSTLDPDEIHQVKKNENVSGFLSKPLPTDNLRKFFIP
ncbi:MULTISPECIES: response regulator [Flavobacterium]|uniref:Response regulator n=1 Tax=Flavobacterium endoglycinae TaxID=2816357 RepID=A0ABX7QGW4_9FLAO|nr:response regulator [Flavobacterium endoglycinae]QSW90321.1 response regulator [Flavobacterium endoglycinae]